METDSKSLIALPATRALRHDGWTPEKQRDFCEVLAETGNVTRAAKTAGMTTKSAYQYRRKPKGRLFRMAWDGALVLARQKLVDQVFELAFEGTHEKIFKDGEVVGERRKRDSRSILTTLEKLAEYQSLNHPHTRLVSEHYDDFLEMMTAYGDEEYDDFEEPVNGFITDHGGHLPKAALQRDRSGKFLPVSRHR